VVTREAVELPWAVELGDRLEERLGPVELEQAKLLPGGASKEAWAVDVRGPDGRLELLVRRAGGGVIHADTLPLEHEYRVIVAADAAGVRVPRPCGYLGELGGREAFVVERVVGETIGRRIVQKPELAGARAALPLQLAEELAKVHEIPPEDVPFLRSRDVLERFERELDSVAEPHPAIELGLWWLREHRPAPLDPVVSHGDFRIGNVVVSERGLEYLLDWEFAHVGDPREDVAWPLVRAWRFGVDERRLGGVGDVEPYLERYCELSWREIGVDELLWWEVLGNVKWAIGALTQSRRHLSGRERSVELAVLGRLAAEMEYELLDLLERAG
jgi:aminoglycoside phosphotransferase (APT) family kinase protein